MGFNAGQIEEIEKGIKNGVDVSMYAKPEFSWWQMREIRMKMLEEKNNGV